jgi:hypothetical protein
MLVRRMQALAAAALGLGASAAVAEPLTYPIRPADALANVAIVADAVVSYGPPLGPPVHVNFADLSANLAGRPNGNAVADTGLPSFDAGAHGIWLHSFQANTSFLNNALLLTDVFGQLPPIPSPVPLVGAAYFLDIADLTIRTTEPLVSPLLPNGTNEFLWAGEAALVVEGAVNLFVTIPGQEPIGLQEPVPFSVPLDTAGLTGGFSGDAASTTLDVGVPPLEVETDLPPSTVPIDLGALGSVSVTLTRLTLVVDGTFTGVNRKYGLTGGAPAAVPGCGMGPELALLVPALAALRRRRRP